MTLLHVFSPVLAFVLLAAHFYRSGNYAAIAACALALALFFVRRPWAARILQAGLLLGALEWARTAITLALARSEAGQPYLRLALILGGAALFTALAALVFRSERMRSHFGFEAAEDTSSPHGGGA